MADGPNILTIRSHMLADQLSPTDYLSTSYAGLYYTEEVSFSPNALKLATAVMNRVTASNRQILVDQARTLGDAPIKVLDVLRSRDPDGFLNMRALMNSAAVASIIAGAYALVCPNRYYTEKEWELLCSK